MSDYYRVNYTIKPYNSDAADLLAAFLADAGFDSFEQNEEGVAGYIQADLYDAAAVAEALEAFPFEAEITSEKELIPHTDWNEEWEKKYFNPLVLADGRCVVRSSFHKDYPAAEMEILVDPKMAFGTGHHATTAMMVNHLFHSDIAGKRVLDMGTGTGILAIIAKKLGAGSVTGVEIDPSAYENALENVSLNHAEVLLLQGDAALLKGMAGVDLFLANINRNIILADLPAYIETLASDGQIILSGFYISDVPMIEAALKENGMRIAETITEGKDAWASVRAVKA